MAHVGVEEVPILLDGLTGDKDPGVRAAAADALTDVKDVKEMEDVLDALVRSWEEDKDHIVKFSTLCSMGLLGNMRALKTLKRVLADEEQNDLYIGAAILAVANLAPSAEEYLDLLLRHVKSKDTLTRRNVAEALGTYANHPKTLQALHQLADREEVSFVREAAVRSLDIAEKKMGL